MAFVFPACSRAEFARQYDRLRCVVDLRERSSPIRRTWRFAA